MKKTRAYQAGQLMARALIEMIHLMYQDRTALKFLYGLTEGLNRELDKRKANQSKKKD